jgi:hypothetical protein
MLNMLRRTRRLTLIVCGLAVLAAGSTASVASAEKIKPTDNTGTVKKGETRADGKQCKNYKSWYDGDVKAGDAKGAAYDKQLADDRGCRWAEMRVPQGSTDPRTSSVTVTVQR